jgi:hypothetical protein
MMAGLAWAIALVNMQTPRVMEEFLRLHAAEATASDAFANGVMSSIVMRYDTSPEDTTLESFQRHAPAPAVQPLWEELVAKSCRSAIQRHHPVLRSRRQLEEVFRYQSLAERTG